jgi:hypothetical protein
MAKIEARFQDFVRSFGGHWFNYMSGAPSVPAAIIALYVSNPITEVLLWLTAAACVVLSSYLVWRVERLKVIELSGRLAPKLEASFNADKRGIVDAIDREFINIAGTSVSYIQETKAKYLRLCLRAATDVTVRGCEVYIVALEKRRNGGEVFIHIMVPQAISLRGAPFDVKPRIDEMVDFLETKNDQLFSVSNWPNTLQNVFSEHGIYRFTFKIHGDGVGTDTVTVDVDWRGMSDIIWAKQVDPTQY